MATSDIHANVTVHINEALDKQKTDEVCSTIEHMNGVIKVRCAEHKPHLLVVEYDPDIVNSHAILDSVTNRGLHAELLGL